MNDETQKKLMTLAIVSIIALFGFLLYKMKDFDFVTAKNTMSTIGNVVSSFNKQPANTSNVAGLKIDPVTIGVITLFGVTILVLLRNRK